MDRLDRKILDFLQKDSTISNVDLANKIGLAPSSCLRRVRQLWKSGVITRSVVLTDPEKMGRSIKVIVNVKLIDHGNEARKDWLAALQEERSVSQAYSVSGDIDVVVVMTFENMKQFRDVSNTLFASDSNVIQYVSQFVLEEHKFELAN